MPSCSIEIIHSTYGVTNAAFWIQKQNHHFSNFVAIIFAHQLQNTILKYMDISRETVAKVSFCSCWLHFLVSSQIQVQDTLFFFLQISPDKLNGMLLQLIGKLHSTSSCCFPF